MKVINKSRKIIAVGNEPLLPEKELELSEEMRQHPAIMDYLKRGVIADTASVIAPSLDSGKINNSEKVKIAEEAIARYKAEQRSKDAAKEAEIKALQAMKKPELITKAMGMGLEANDTDNVEMLKGKILKALNG